MPDIELHIFSLHLGHGPWWCANHLLAPGPSQIRGEITPDYLFHPEAPQRIHALLPQAKLIVMLRDPVERTLPKCIHSLQLGLESLPLEEALAAEPARLAGADVVLREPCSRQRSHQEHSYLSRSRYGGQLSRYEALFSRRAWRGLERFLGLTPATAPGLPERANASGLESAQVPGRIRRRLGDQLLPTYALMRRYYGLTWCPRDTISLRHSSISRLSSSYQ